MFNLVFGSHFVFLAAIFFLANKWRMAILNYHAKSGASSTKIDWVMLNLVFDPHFVFLWPFCFFNKKIVEGHYSISGAYTKFSFWWPFYFFASIFLLYGCRQSRSTFMQKFWLLSNCLWLLPCVAPNCSQH